MSYNQISDEVAREAASLVEEHGSIRKAAKAAGVAYSTMHARAARAAERGFSTTGELPEGVVLKGYSTLYDAEGTQKAQWVKVDVEKLKLQEAMAAIEDTFEAYTGRAELGPAPVGTDADLLTVYNLADHHLGMYAWAKETGADYDLDIAERLLTKAMETLVAEAPRSRQALVLNLGDFFHSDSNENRTRRSGAALDVDTRYAKVLQLGVTLNVRVIELALQKHETVLVRILPGNHDPYAALALAVALAAFFRNEERVTVDTDPSPFFWHKFGRVLIGATHGDNVKPDEMAGIMATVRPQWWGETEFRYAYLGHVHHRSRGGGEGKGVIWETFQTLAPKDSWHAWSGYVSGRSMTAITHHKEYGEVARNIRNVPRPQKRSK